MTNRLPGILLVCLLITACAPTRFSSLLNGQWTLTEQRGGFRIQPAPMPVLQLRFSGSTYQKLLDARVIETGNWAVAEETKSGDTLRATIVMKTADGDAQHKIRSIGKRAFVLDEDAPAYDGVAYYYRKGK